LLQITDLPPANDGFALWPDFSPDGERIVFPHDMTGALELYVINADGTGLTQITHDGAPHISPRWSPDGTRILFSTVGEAGPLVLATIRADGTDMEVLTTPFWDSLGAVYRSDGKYIVASSSMDGYVAALWIMDSHGHNPRRFSEPELEASNPDVSPAGTEAVFNTNQNTNKTTSTIFKVDIKSGVAIPLTSEGHYGGAVFSPDGTKILFMSDGLSPGSVDIFVMNADGSDRKRIIEGFVPNWGPQPQP
jgi:Tol biopolymer transport system component